MDINEIYPELGSAGKDFKKHNNEILMKILSDNKDTEWGRRYGFGEIRSPEEYRNRMPVFGYEAYRSYVERLVNGEKNLLSNYERYCFLQTSGSTDRGKILPITLEALSRYGNVIDRYMELQAEQGGGKRLMVSFIQADGKKPVNTDDTMLLSSCYYSYLLEQEILDPDTLAGGGELSFYPGACDYLYAKLWLAFATTDIISMESIFLYDFLIFFHYMEENYDRVLSDMEKGKIPDEVDLPQEVKDRLTSLRFHRDRIARVREECGSGFAGIVKRLWKDMKLISGIGSKVFQTEEISIRKYIGDLDVWHYSYASSECMIAVPAGMNTYDYILYPKTAYYEFRPVDKEEVLSDPSALKVGECYELILTTFSGLYRYAMGDILKVTGFFEGLPIILFQYRKNLVLNIAGEKLDMKTLDQAMLVWSKISRLSIWQYYFYEEYDEVPACYRGIVALEPDGENIREEAADQMDKCLRGLSLDYDDLRKLGSISQVRLSFVNKDEFMELKKKKSSNGQPKPLHIMN